jgi:L-ascorbate metabolism protein UlaG (beta-lactamase superfamily)
MRIAHQWLAGMTGWVAAGASALAQESISFTGIQALTNQEIRLTLTAPPGSNYRIETTTDWRQWDNLLTARGVGTAQHLDSAAPWLEARLYRAREVTEAGALTGDHLATADGDLVIHPINHASLVLQWNGRMIYVDPVGGGSAYQGLAKADLILITHDHSDHFHAATIEAVRQTNSVLLVSSRVHSSLGAAPRAQAQSLTNGAFVEVLGLRVEAVPAYNLTASNHPKGVGNGYVLTVGGKRVYFSGDTEDIPEMRALANIDVAFLCMNTPYTMTVAKAASAVQQFRPKVVYPYHYRNADGTFADLELFRRLVSTTAGVEVRRRNWY